MQETNLIDLSQFSMTNEELFSRVDNNLLQSEKITAPRYSYWKSVFRVFFRNKTNYFVLVLLLLVVVFTYIYAPLSHYNPYEFTNDPTMKHIRTAELFSRFGFSFKYILGTGALGQSVFQQMWNGAKISISLAFICAAINMAIGVVLGAVWGFSKKFDLVMTEIYNIIGNVPYVLIISVLVLILSANFWTMVFALTITGWIGIAYFIRVQVIIIRDREYNLASRCLGTPILRLVTKNILPFMTSVIVTLIATELPSYISYEVFLSYIGIGLSDMSLGRIIYTTESNMLLPNWAIEFWAPVVIASVITIALYVVGQNLGDASDPRTHM